MKQRTVNNYFLYQIIAKQKSPFKLYSHVWEQRKLGDVVQIERGGSPRPIDDYITDSQNGLNWVKIGDAPVQGHYITKTAEKIKPEGLSKTREVHPGDLILSNSMSFGKPYIMGIDGCIHDGWLLIRDTNSIFNLSFLCHLLGTPQMLDQYRSLAAGSTVNNLNKELVENTVVTIPKIDVQKVLSQYLDQLNNLITLHQRECTKLINIKNITLTKMIKSIPDLKFPKFTNVWEQRKLRELITVWSGKDYKHLSEGTIPVYGTGGYMLSVNEALSYDKDAIGIGRKGTIDKPYILKAPFWTVDTLFYTIPKEKVDLNFAFDIFQNIDWKKKDESTGVPSLSKTAINDINVFVPIYDEQQVIGHFFSRIDRLITLHQRECKNQNGRCHMLSEVVTTDLFCDYYIQWVKVYKEGAVRKVTLDKYMMTYSWLLKLASHLRLCDITRVTYQQILNDYAITHEKQTTMDFHHQLKGAIADAVDDGLITKDPTRKAIIKGKTPTPKKIKYLNQYELHTLLSNLQLKDEINWDWLILLVAKTGMRFSEALAITPSDFDFAHQMLSISKTWNYKGNGGFLPTKNKSSVRKIQLDWQTVIQFSELVKRLPPEKPIFITKERVYNSTVNDVLARHCTKNNIPVISIHGLRHTHASLLLFAGVSIASVARRLGHSSMTTTQKTYLHIIQELENKDIDLVMRSLSGLS